MTVTTRPVVATRPVVRPRAIVTRRAVITGTVVYRRGRPIVDRRWRHHHRRCGRIVDGSRRVIRRRANHDTWHTDRNANAHMSHCRSRRKAGADTECCEPPTFHFLPLCPRIPHDSILMARKFPSATALATLLPAVTEGSHLSENRFRQAAIAPCTCIPDAQPPQYRAFRAAVEKLVDSADLKSAALTGLRVRVPSAAPTPGWVRPLP